MATFILFRIAPIGGKKFLPQGLYLHTHLFIQQQPHILAEFLLPTEIFTLSLTAPTEVKKYLLLALFQLILWCIQHQAHMLEEFLLPTDQLRLFRIQEREVNASPLAFLSTSDML